MTTPVTSNRELLLKELEDNLLSQIDDDIDNYVRLPSENKNIFMFFNKMTNKVIEISFKNKTFQYHHYYFNNKMSFCIQKTKDDHRFICVDWSIDELTILSHKIEEYGIKNYIIKHLPYKPMKDNYPSYNMFEIIFSDAEDCSTFEVYFAHFFRDHDDKEIVKTLEANKLLDKLL